MNENRQWGVRGVFLALHLAAGVYSGWVLTEAWRLRLVLAMLMDSWLRVGEFVVSSWVIPAALVSTVVLALASTLAILWRARCGQIEVDVLLRLKVAVFFALGCVLTNVFVFSTPETFHGPFRVRYPVNVHICTALFYGLYAAWSTFLPVLRRRLSARVRHGAEIVAANLVVIVVLAELSLRGLALVWTHPILMTETTSSQVRRDAQRQTPGTLRFGFPINSGGHYDSDWLPSDAARGPVVISIGDSFSYGVVPHAYHYTTVAEEELPGVNFYNMGFSAIGPSDYRFLLEHEALKLKPDVVVIQLFIGNDLAADASPAGPARWYDADSYLLSITVYRVLALLQAELEGIGVDASPAGNTRDQLKLTYPWVEDPMLEKPTYSEEVHLGVELRNAIEVCSAGEAMYLYFFQQIEAIQRTAGDIPLAFVLIPGEFQIEDSTWEEITKRAGVPLDRDRPQRKVVEWMRDRGLPVLDLLPVLRDVKPMADGRRHLYHLRDTHFNARGNEVAGRALADFVAPMLKRRAKPVPPAGTVNLPLRIQLGEEAALPWMRLGWHLAEDAGGRRFAWSGGLRSTLAGVFPTDSDITMEFEVLPFTYPDSPPQSVTVMLNGVSVQQVPLRPGLHKYSVNLPASLMGTLSDVIAFKYDYAKAPSEVLKNSRDTRVLAVAWYSILFTGRE